MGAEGIVGCALAEALNDFAPVRRSKGRRAPRVNEPGLGGRFTLFRISMAEARLRRVTRSLDSDMFPCLHTMFSPIPTDCITRLKENYSEKLLKTLRFKTALISSRSSRARRASDLLGVTSFLKSEELRLFGAQVTGKQLSTNPNCQIICYEPGDFCGPHTDHHPEQRELRDGYVDIHIMLSDPNVLSQFLVYEKRRGLLNAVEEVGIGVSIAVYELPFWHYTTPLISRLSTRNARRWVLVASYILE